MSYFLRYIPTPSKVVVVVVFFFFFNYLNRIIIMDMCVKFIIVTSYDELITNKVL